LEKIRKISLGDGIGSRKFPEKIYEISFRGERIQQNIVGQTAALRCANFIP
jgi:hypothetical protein